MADRILEDCARRFRRPLPDGGPHYLKIGPRMQTPAPTGPWYFLTKKAHPGGMVSVDSRIPRGFTSHCWISCRSRCWVRCRSFFGSRCWPLLDQLPPPGSQIGNVPPLRAALPALKYSVALSTASAMFPIIAHRLPAAAFSSCAMTTWCPSNPQAGQTIHALLVPGASHPMPAPCGVSLVIALPSLLQIGQTAFIIQSAAFLIVCGVTSYSVVVYLRSSITSRAIGSSCARCRLTCTLGLFVYFLSGLICSHSRRKPSRIAPLRVVPSWAAS